MKAALNYRYPVLETFTIAYYEMTGKVISEHSKQIAMENRKNINVLIADDDDDDREFFAEVITDLAPEVKISCAKNGATLMALINEPETVLPDLIFLDLNMPCKNGRECLKEIKKSPRLRHIPIIIYSTSSNVKDIENAYTEGADLYVTKPNTFPELKRMAKKILNIDWNSFILNHRIEKFVLR
ncbi:MAG TPA: response regulator [Bacteroidia bacterium]|jgi:CheY-like chemotaxis protein